MIIYCSFLDRVLGNLGLVSSFLALQTFFFDDFAQLYVFHPLKCPTAPNLGLILDLHLALFVFPPPNELMLLIIERLPVVLFVFPPLKPLRTARVSRRFLERGRGFLPPLGFEQVALLPAGWFCRRAIGPKSLWCSDTNWCNTKGYF